MYRTLSATAKQCSRLVRSPAVTRRNFALVNDYSVRKRMTIGLSGFAVVAVGCFYGGRKIYRNRKAKKIAASTPVAKIQETPVVEPVLPVVPETPAVEEKPIEDVPVEESVTSAEQPESQPNENETVAEEVVATEATQGEEEKEEKKEKKEDEITEVDDGVYRPWWTGVKEISLFLNNEDCSLLDEHFPSTRPFKPQRKVMLCYNPRPEDANEFGPVMGDDFEVKIIAMVSDEHAQVLVVDIGNVESAYRYPHIVLSCDDEDRAAAYSSVYGRLLVDRCVTDGLLVEESPNVYVPKEDVENVAIEGYYSYPETHVTVKDLRNENLTIKTRLCTSRGMNNEDFGCSEGKNTRECSWCVFMKSGPCFKPFEVWQKCILENQEDADSFITNCGEITMALKKCVDAHPEYYGKMSQPENQVEEEEEKTAEEVAEQPMEQPMEQPIEKVEVVEEQVVMEQPMEQPSEEKTEA